MLCGLKNVTKASSDTGQSSKWVKFHFLINYPFYVLTLASLRVLYPATLVLSL